jgi:hypothetical protein
VCRKLQGNLIHPDLENYHMNTSKMVSRVGLKKSVKRTPRNRVLFVLLFALCLSMVVGGTIFSQMISLAKSVHQDPESAASLNQISSNALQQIEALIAEKKARTSLQQKIDPQLLFAEKMHRGEQIAPGVQSLVLNVSETKAGFVIVDITGTVSEPLIDLLKATGATILASTPAYGSVRAEVALDKLEVIAASSAVRYIQSKQEAMTSRRDVSNTVFGGNGPGPGSFLRRSQIVRETANKSTLRLGTG